MADFLDRLLAALKSAIVRQQLVQLALVVASIAGATGLEVEIESTVDKVIAGAIVLIPAITLLTRIFRPAPNITATAARKEQELRLEGKITTDGSFPITK